MIGWAVAALLAIWLLGFLGHKNTEWRLGPLSWLRAGKVRMIEIGRLKVVGVGWRCWHTIPANDGRAF